jgi:Tol biopolymer transport system component
LTSDHAGIQALDVSADGTYLALDSDRRGNMDLWLLPATGGEMTQLTTDLTPDWNPRWSPDGKEVAFYACRSGNRDIWVMPAQGGPARQLTSDPGEDLNPTWSPDGREIAYRSAGRSGTFILSAKGGEPRRLAAGVESPVEWVPPDGRWLLIQREGRLHRVAREGGEPQPLPARNGPAPSLGRFSRDGRSMYYSVVSGPREDHDLWKLSLGDGTISRLTTLRGRRGGIGSALAADERYLYYTWREDVGDISVMDVERR